MQIISRNQQAPIIVFVNLIADVDSLHEHLTRAGKRVTLIHGKKSQEQREKGLNALRDGHADILVCTNVVARGIDIENVAHVINYNAPANITEYIHRIGRTGRAGKQGLATTIINMQTDEALLYDLKKHLIDNDQPIPLELSHYIAPPERPQASVSADGSKMITRGLS